MTAGRDGEQIAGVLQRLYDAYNRHDADAAGALYADVGEHEDVAVGRIKRGRDAITEGLRFFLAAFPDARWELSDRLEADSRALARYVLTGTLQRDFGPFKAAGQPLRLRGVLALELDAGGLIERSEDFWDSATFQRQMSTDTGGRA